MRKYFYAIMIVFFSQLTFSQESQMLLGGQRVNSNNYFEITRQLDDYWLSRRDRLQKGSGYKVYQRWKELWKNSHHEDGTLFSQDEIQNVYFSERKITPTNVVGQNNVATEENVISSWIPLGPFSHTNSGSWSPGQGRVNVTLVDPNDPNTIYIGTPNGGLWKSINHGNSWVNLTDFLPTIGVSGFAVDYANSNIVYISPGDEDAIDSFSSGVFKSLDGGLTWGTTGFPVGNFSVTGEIYIHPTQSNILWVVGSQGFYKSVDAGLTWTQKNGGFCKEMRLKPGDPNTIYLVENNYITDQVFIKKSTNGGESFATIQSYSNAGRTVIAVTPADAAYLYVMVSNSDNTFKGMYRSINSGATFNTQNTTANIYESQQAWFDLALTVSEEFEDLIFTGCLNIWGSVDGGQNFYQVNEWFSPDSPSYAHADVHDLKFFNGKLYAGTDGGIYISEDSGNIFSDKTINGVGIGQFYRIDVKQGNGTNIAGGLQDNGGYQILNNEWYNYHGADGMDAVVHPFSNYSLGFIQFGLGLFATTNSELPLESDYIVASPNEVLGNWITPLEMGTGGKLYAGYDLLYSLNPVNNQWEAEIPFSFTDDHIDQIKIDPTNDLRVMFSSDNRLFISNGLSPMIFIESIVPGSGFITNFAFNHQNPQILYVTKSSQVLKSTNGGVTWQNISFNLPTTRKIDIVHQAGSTNNTIYVALSKAVYFLDDSSNTWSIISNGLPNSTITDLEINAVENHVLVSTYGRGIWRTSVAPSSLSTNEFDDNRNSLFFYPNPSKNGWIQLNTTINEPLTIKLFDLKGSMVYHRAMNEILLDTKIDLSSVNKGKYIIQLVSEHHLITKQIWIE